MKTLKNIILEKILINKNSNILNIKTNKYILYLPFKIVLINKDIDIYDYDESDIKDSENKRYVFYDKDHKRIFTLTTPGLHLLIDWRQRMMSDTCYGFKPIYLSNDCNIKKI